MTARPKTLFATHYHELTDVADALPNVTNCHVVAREWEDEIHFLRKVEAGRSDRSYGIQVARLAGLPRQTVERAKTILAGLERDELARSGHPTQTNANAEPLPQLALFSPSQADTSIARRLREADLERITPIDALTLLAELKKDTE